MKSTKSKKYNRLLQTECHIGIIGSGLGGLSAALAILQCDVNLDKNDHGRRAKKTKSGEECSIENNEIEEGHDPSCSGFQGRITIYERDLHPNDRKEGYGMTITYNPGGPLAQLGVLEAIAQKDCPSRSHYLFTEKGEVMGYYGNAFHDVSEENPSVEDEDGVKPTVSAFRGAGQRGNLRIPRSELRSILMDKIRGVNEQNRPSKFRIEWGKRLVSYVDRPATEKLSQIHDVERKAENVRNAVSGQSSEATCQRPVLLQFEDGTTDDVDLLIGADGINSIVAKQYLSTTSQSKSKQSTLNIDISPQYLGIFIIIGISHHFHPLIDERGYYTLDMTHRLFIMPFEGSRIQQQSRRTMWQLSYPVVDREEANRLSKLDPSELQQEVLKLCGHWHEPFPEMVKQTPLVTIWGTGLLDRDPDIFIQHRKSLEIHGRIPCHVVLLGDAAHAMSPFKGSGANQALADGPLLAKWLSHSKFDSAVRGYMTEMARRSGVKVRASREAATKLHSKDCWEWMASQDGVTSAIFHGVHSDHVKSLLDTLRERSISASLGSTLDNAIRATIKEMNISSTAIRSSSLSSEMSPAELCSLQAEALGHASSGNLQQLRLISRKSHLIIPLAVDSSHKSCLHLAASHGHLDVCGWLLSEAKIDPKLLDQKNKTALQIAEENGNEKTAQLIRSWITGALSNEREEEPPSTRIGLDTPEDLYRVVEKQLRVIRTMNQLCSLLRSNRQGAKSKLSITHVLGLILDSNDEEQHIKDEEVLAREHGAIVLRNFVSREVDQLALAALALRPLELDTSAVIDKLLDTKTTKIRKQTKVIKSQISIPAHSPVIIQTNFGPEFLSHTSQNASKKRRVESFCLSKLRYLNIGKWNYNWGDRRYDRVPQAHPFPEPFSKLAHDAYSIAWQQVHKSHKSEQPENTGASHFDMAICNFYHLQRPSDRLGGHKDDVESDLTSPLITISLGAPGIFLLGGASRNTKPTAILLRAGDCMIMSGQSRQYFHGVPTILDYEDHCESSCPAMNGEEPVFPELRGDMLSESTVPFCNQEDMATPSYNELLFAKAFLTTTRMNISIRQI
ncbi:hypothetical protein HJC23_003098 [Cyclotella cryptica]|uniref:Fe2OG dioxygenase domain-containing protein n=1 Tax=Cyclotella cryptica TaxID=29204 RepID=A0ABD3P4Z0_9STRA|eukprot:CCRYP_017660-RA/>CCRYP_017660-RA protein AED:0.09 eAED:-0.07 QI:0/0/0/1/1/1/2/0/1071